MVIAVNKKEFKNALEIAAKVASGTGRIREYDRVYIGVDSSKPDGILVFGKGSGGAVQITLTTKARETVTLQDGELIEFCAKGFLDELKTYDTADIDFSFGSSKKPLAREKDKVVYIGRPVEYKPFFPARIVKNDFVFTNSGDYFLSVPAYKLTECFKSTLSFARKPDAQFTDEYWACGVNLSVDRDKVILKTTDRHVLAHAEIQDDFGKKGDDFEVTLKPGALNVFVKSIVRKDDDSAVIVSPGAESQPCVIRYLNYTLSVPKINQRYQYGKELVPTVWDYSAIFSKSEFIDALKGFVRDLATIKLTTHSFFDDETGEFDLSLCGINFEDAHNFGFKRSVSAIDLGYGSIGIEIGFNAPMFLSVLKAIQWSGDKVEFSVHLNKDKKYACAGALFSNPNDENKDIKASWYVCEVMLNAGE